MFIPFSQDIIPKENVIEFDLGLLEVAVQHFNYYATKIGLFLEILF